MMGECRKELKDWGGGILLPRNYTKFSFSTEMGSQVFEQAIRCYEQAGLVDQVSGIEKQYADWQRNYLD